MRVPVHVAPGTEWIGSIGRRRSKLPETLDVVVMLERSGRTDDVRLQLTSPPVSVWTWARYTLKLGPLALLAIGLAVLAAGGGAGVLGILLAFVGAGWLVEAITSSKLGVHDDTLVFQAVAGPLALVLGSVLLVWVRIDRVLALTLVAAVGTMLWPRLQFAAQARSALRADQS